MAQKKQDLFQWNRKTGPLRHNKHGKKKDSIQDWIKRVQDASEDVLGDDIIGPDSLREIIPDDEAVYEAQQLLDGWMKETSLPNLHNELEYKCESWSSSTGILLNDDYDYLNTDYNDNTALSVLSKKYLGNDHANSNDYVGSLACNEASHSGIYSPCNNDEEDIDDALLVQDILHGMLSKDFARNIDLEMKPLEQTAKNPVPRMNIRHEQVKVRGEKRRQNNVARKNEQLTQEEIAQKARERVVREEQQRIRKENVDEKAILSEMEKIKRELAEVKQQKEGEALRKKKILDEAKLQMQMELRKQKEEEVKRRKEKEEARRFVRKKMDEEVLRELRLNMKVLHKYFSAWYNVVLERRLNMGKARAIADWKCKIRAWKAWKAYISCVKSNQQAKEIELAMKEKYRKEQMSIKHCNKTLEQKCFSSWCRYTHYKIEKKMVLLEHEEKAKKMALFLEAASKGDLWGKKSPEEVKREVDDDLNSLMSLVEGEDESHDLKECKASAKPRHSLTTKTHLHEKETSVKNDQLHTTTQQFTMKGKSKDKLKQKKEKLAKYAAQAEPIHTTRTGEKSLHNCKKGEGSSQTCVEGIDHFNQNTKNGIMDPSILKGNTNEEMHLQNSSKLLTDRSDVSSVSSQLSSIVSRKPQIRSGKQITKPLHLAMEERQKERSKRKAAIEVGRKKREEERLEALRAKEAERLGQEQLEKEERLRQRQEEKKLEAFKRKEKDFQAEQLRLKTQIAKAHYEKVLLRKYGLEPFTRLLQVAKLNIQISDKYHNSLLMRVCFVEWHDYVEKVLCDRRERADLCYKRIILKRAFRSWLKCRFHLQSMNKLARNHSLARLLHRAFYAWQEHVTDERILMWAKESSAEEHDSTRMTRKFLRAWVNYVKTEKEERECEHRKDEWRKKVQLWLPDYKGGGEA